MASVFCVFCERKYNARPKVYTKDGFVPICWLCRQTTPPTTFRCGGLTTKNIRCTKWVTPTQKYCKLHRGQEYEYR
jgi:hypothetical protein